MKETGIAIEERDGRLIAVGISVKGPGPGYRPGVGEPMLHRRKPWP